MKKRKNINTGCSYEIQFKNHAYTTELVYKEFKNYSRWLGNSFKLTAHK